VRKEADPQRSPKQLHVTFIVNMPHQSLPGRDRSSVDRICGKTELLVASMPTCPWVSSITFPKVYDTCPWNPRLKRFVAPNCRALYQERPPAVLKSIEPQLGLRLGPLSGKNLLPSG
jgi:hypothetical protein